MKFESRAFEVKGLHQEEDVILLESSESMQFQSHEDDQSIVFQSLFGLVEEGWATRRGILGLRKLNL